MSLLSFIGILLLIPFIFALAVWSALGWAYILWGDETAIKIWREWRGRKQ